MARNPFLHLNEDDQNLVQQYQQRDSWMREAEFKRDYSREEYLKTPETDAEVEPFMDDSALFQHEIAKARREYLSSLDVVGDQGVSLGHWEKFASPFMDIDTGEMQFGIQTQNEASWELTRMGHSTGFANLNAGNLYIRGRMVESPEIREQLGGIFVTEMQEPEAIAATNHYTAAKYNINDLVEMVPGLGDEGVKAPIGSNWGIGRGTVEDWAEAQPSLLLDEEGNLVPDEDVGEALLKHMEENAPEVYVELAVSGFDFDRLREVKNTHQFMLQTMDHFQNVAMMQSLAYHKEVDEDSFWVTAWSFVRDSFIDDPDSSTEMAIGVGLSFTGIAPALVIANKLRKGAMAYKKYKKLVKLAEKTSEGLILLKKAQTFLPSQLPGTVMHKILPSVTAKWANLTWKGRAGKIGAYLAANGTEGFISGTGVSVLDQWHNMEHYDHEFSYGEMWMEGGLEALISPGANFAMTNLFKGSNAVAGWTGEVALNSMFDPASAGKLGDSLKLASRLNSAQNSTQLSMMVDFAVIEGELKVALESELGMELSWEQLNNSPHFQRISSEFMMSAEALAEVNPDLTTSKLVADWRAGRETQRAEMLKTDPDATMPELTMETAMVQLSTIAHNRMLDAGIATETSAEFQARMGQTHMQVMLDRLHAEDVESGEFEGTIEEYYDWVTDTNNPERLLKLIPTELKSQVEARWDSLEPDQQTPDNLRAAVNESLNEVFESQIIKESTLRTLQEESLGTIVEAVDAAIQKAAIDFDFKGARQAVIRAKDGSGTVTVQNPNWKGRDVTDVITEQEEAIENAEPETEGLKARELAVEALKAANEKAQTRTDKEQLESDADAMFGDGTADKASLSETEGIAQAKENLIEQSLEEGAPSELGEAIDILDGMESDLEGTSDTSEVIIEESDLVEQLEEGAKTDEEKKTVEDMKKKLAERDAAGSAKQDLLDKKRALEDRLEALQKREAELTEELETNDPDFQEKSKIDKEVGELDAEATALGLIMPSILTKMNNRKESKSNREEAAQEYKKHEAKKKAIGKKLKAQKKALTAVKKKLKKKKSPSIVELRDNIREQAGVIDESSGIDLIDLIQGTEGSTGAMQYRVATYVASQLEALAERKKLIETLLEDNFMTNETISRQKLVDLLFAGKNGRDKALNNLNKEWEGKEEFTQEETSEIIREWKRHQTNRVLELKRFKKTIERTGEELVELNNESIPSNAGTPIGDIHPDAHAGRITKSPEDAAKETKDGKVKINRHTRENEEQLLNDAFRNLTTVRQTLFGPEATRPTQEDSRVGTASEDIILAAFPPELRDIGLHVLFSEAIVNPEAGPFNETNKHLARYDIGIIQDDLAALLALSSETNTLVSREMLNEARARLKDPNNQTGRYDLYGTLKDIETDQTAIKEVTEELWNENGYTLELDRSTRSFIGRHSSEPDYVSRVRQEAIKRLVTLASPRRINRLMEEFEVTDLERAKIKKYLQEHPDEKLSESEAFYEEVLGLILDKFLAKYELSLSDFGNGTLDWQPATEVGKGLAHTLVHQDEGTKRARAIDSTKLKDFDTDTRLTERNPVNTSLKPVTLVEGELNHAAPHRAQVLADIKADFKIRARITHVLNHTLTPEEVKAFFEWAADKEKEGLPLEELLGMTPLGMHLMPDITNRTPFTSPPNMAEHRQRQIEAMLDMPAALFDFIHDSQTLAQGDKMFFMDVMEIFDNQTEFLNDDGTPKEVSDLTPEERQALIDDNPTVAVYHKEAAMSAGTPSAAVNLGGLSVVLGWEMTYPALEGTSWQALDRGLEYINKHEGTPVEALFSTKNYFDKSFNGKHHFRAMMFDRDHPDTSRALLEIGKGLGLYQTDEYVKAARSTKESLEKVLREGAIDPEKSGLSSEELVHLQKFYDAMYAIDMEGQDDIVADRNKKLREFWKMPIMTRLYSAGEKAIGNDLNAFLSEEKNGWKGEFSSAEIKSFTKFLVSKGVIEGNIVLDKALELGTVNGVDLKKKVIQLLSQPLAENGKKRWDAYQRSHDMATEDELRIKRDGSAPVLDRRLKERIQFIAEATGEDPKKVAEFYAERIQKAKQFLVERGATTANQLSSEEYHDYLQILCYDEAAYRTMPLLKAMNTVNRTARGLLETSRVEQESLGWRHATKEDLFMKEGEGGAMDHVWFHTFAVDLAGNRFHPAYDFGFKTHNTSWSRTYSQNENAQGMWELKNNPFYAKHQERVKAGMDPAESRAEAIHEIDAMIVRDFQLRLAGEQKPMFGDFEDKTDAEFYSAWKERSDTEAENWEKGRDLEEQLDSDMRGWDGEIDPESDAAKQLGAIEKNQGLPSKVRFLQVEEGGRRFGGNALEIDTSNAAGFAAFRPKMADIDFFDRGILELRKIKVLRDIEQQESYLARREEAFARQGKKIHVEGQSVIPESARGFAHIWDESEMPIIPWQEIDWTNELAMVDKVGHMRLASKLRSALPAFAQETGLTHLLEAGHVAHLFYVMRLHQIQNRHMENLGREYSKVRAIIERSDKLTAEQIAEIELETKRIAYLDDVWGLFKQEQDALTYDWRYQELFPSKGLPTFVPGFENPRVYRSVFKSAKRNIKKNSRKWKAEREKNFTPEEKAEFDRINGKLGWSGEIGDISEQRLKDFWEALMTHEASELAQAEARKQKNNTYRDVLGKYKERTNNVEAFTLPMVPVSHIILEEGEMVWDPEKRKWVEGGIDFSDTAVLPLAVQGQDVFDIQNQVLADENVRSAIDEKVEEGKKLIEKFIADNGRPPTSDDFHTVDDQVAYMFAEMDKTEDSPLSRRAWQIRDRAASEWVYNKAYELGTFRNIGNFYLFVHADDKGSYNGIIGKPQRAAKAQRENIHEMRRGATVGTHSRVKGSTWRYRLTPEAILMALNSLNNHKGLRYQEEANLLNIKRNEHTSHSDNLANRPFFDQRNNERILTDVLEEIQAEAGGAELQTVDHGFQGYRGARHRVTKASSYLFPTLAEQDAQGTNHAYVTASLVPLLQRIQTLRHRGEMEIVDKLESLMREDMETAVTLGIILRMEEMRGRREFMIKDERLPSDKDSWRDFSVTPETIEVFQPLHDPEASMNKAYDMIRAMNVVLDTRNFDNPMYYPVREALEASMRLETKKTMVGSKSQFDSDAEDIYDKVDVEGVAKETGMEESKVRFLVDKAVIQMTRVDSEDALGVNDPFEYAHSVEPIEFSTHEGFTENLKGIDGPSSDFNYDHQINTLATQIQGLDLSAKQKDILRVMLSQAIIKNPDIVKNLSLIQSPLTKDKLGAALYKSGEFIIKFDTEQIGESTPDIVDVIAHELAHIGVMKFIREGGTEWSEASQMLGTTRGKQMMWDLVKAFHGGTMTAKAENLYNNYVKNPEEFMVQYTAYKMQRGDLYDTGVLSEIEQKYSGEKSLLDKVFAKIGGFYSKLLHDIRQVTHRYKESDPNLYSRMESLSDSIMGLNMDAGKKSFTPSQDMERNVTYVHEGATRPVHKDPTQVAYPVTRIDRPEAEYVDNLERLNRLKGQERTHQNNAGELVGKEADGTITPEEAAELERIRSILPRIQKNIQSREAKIQEADYGKDAVGLTRQDYVEGYLDLKERGALYEVENPDGSIDIKIDFSKLATRRDKQVFMSYVLRHASYKFGDKISENLAGIIRYLGGRGLGLNGFIEGCQKWAVGPSEAAATWLNPDAWGLLMSLMLEDNVVANTGAIANRLGIKTVGQVRREMDMFGQVITREVSDIMYKYSSSVERGAQFVNPNKPMSKFSDINRGAREMVLGIKDEAQLELDGFTPEEIQDMQKLAKVYTGIVDTLLERGEQVGKITSDENRRSDLRIPLKLEKSINVSEEKASGMMSVLEDVIEAKSRLVDSHSNVNNVTLFAQAWMPNYFLTDEDAFDNDWERASEVDNGVYTNAIDMLAMKRYAESQAKGAVDTGSEAFKQIRSDWKDGKIDPASIRRYRRLVISDMVHHTRQEGSSIESIFGDTLTSGQKDVMRRRYNESLKGRGTHAKAVAERLNWLKHNQEGKKKLVDTFTDSQPFSEEIHTEGHHDRANPVNTPAQWHAGVLYQKSNSSAYFPHKHDTHMPTAREIYENEALRDFFTWDFIDLVEGTTRGIGIDASERLVLNEITGDSNVSFLDMINIMEDLQNDGLFNQHGEETSRAQEHRGTMLRTVNTEDTLKVLRRKRNVIHGLGARHGEAANADPAPRMLATAGHGIIRFIYGSNLGTAIQTVEGTLTAMNGIFSLGDVMGTWRQPWILMKSFSKRKRIEMATELAYTLQYTLRDSDGANAFMRDVSVSEAGDKHILHPKRWVQESQRGHKGTAKAADLAMRSAAALQGRRYIMKHLRKGTFARAVHALDAHDAAMKKEGMDQGLTGQDLQTFVESKRPKTQAEWIKILRQSKVPSTSFRHNWRVMLEMQQAGLMTADYMGTVTSDGQVIPGKMEEILNDTDGWNGVYSVGDIARLAVGKEGLSKDEKNAMISLANSLREFDRRFIKRYAIDPNPMDVNTDGSPWSQIINMYRSFPTAFTAQRMIRDASNMSVHGFALKHGTHLVLDMAYMMLIQLAAGKDWEEIDEEFRENPIMTTMRYLARFPGLGPYGGYLAQLVTAAVSTLAGNQARWQDYAPISIAAAYKTMDSMLGTINWKDDQEATEGLIALARFIPFFGEALFRAAGQTAANYYHGDIMGTGSANSFRANPLGVQNRPSRQTGQESPQMDVGALAEERRKHLEEKYLGGRK